MVRKSWNQLQADWNVCCYNRLYSLGMIIEKKQNAIVWGCTKQFQVHTSLQLFTMTGASGAFPMRISPLYNIKPPDKAKGHPIFGLAAMSTSSSHSFFWWKKNSACAGHLSNPWKKLNNKPSLWIKQQIANLNSLVILGLVCIPTKFKNSTFFRKRSMDSSDWAMRSPSFAACTTPENFSLEIS